MPWTSSLGRYFFRNYSSNKLLFPLGQVSLNFLSEILVLLQDGTNVICHGVDTLDTRTNQVCMLKLFCLEIFLVSFSETGFCIIHLVDGIGESVYCWSEFACIGRGWPYIPDYYKSNCKYLFLYL